MTRQDWNQSEVEPMDETVDQFGGNIPLGIMDLANYDQFDVRLKVGDLVVCYTDSLLEARDASGEIRGASAVEPR